MKNTLAVAATAAVLLLPAQLNAQEFDMQAAQESCQDDVFELCGDAMQDHKVIEACLRKHWSKVSHKCRTFMASVGKHHSTRKENCKSAGSDRTSASTC